MRKTLVLGIDSGCWDYIEPLLTAGEMPNVARLIERGGRGVLESTMPPITPVAFASFLTGVNPGKHGVFDWSVRMGEGQRVQPASFLSFRAPPFWRHLNAAGVRVGLFNVPMTYPPTPLEGFIVPGVGAPPAARDLTYPPEVLDRLDRRWGGTYTIGVPRKLLRSQGLEAYVAAWERHEAMQTEAALELMEAYEVDLLAFNYASPDRINHFSPSMEHIARILRHVDRQIGRFIDRYPEANFILMSDHGSRRIQRAFLLGKWLAQHGYAAYGEKSLDITGREVNGVLHRYLEARGWKGTPERLLRYLVRWPIRLLPPPLRRAFWRRLHRSAPEIFAYRFEDRLDWSRTRVFATSNSGPLFINTNGHRLSPEGYEQLREAVIRDLLAVRDRATGEPVFHHVYRREELYHGAALSLAPDLIADHYRSACDLIVDNDLKTFCFVDRLNRFGDHIREGILVFGGPDFAAGVDGMASASILDLPATLLHLYGVPVPQEWDGRVLSELLAPPVRERPVARAEGELSGLSETEGGYTAEDEAQVMDHLRDLGYL
ncbi:MAG TPA: hypothetical protein ENK56_01900 [Chloroflexi bacterium]|nr:hypothetical protein [Chloroflexota bacterium]